jgi:hypothetical protein
MILAMKSALSRPDAARLEARLLSLKGALKTSVKSALKTAMEIMEGKLLPQTQVESLHREADELTAIFVTSIRTAKGL